MGRAGRDWCILRTSGARTLPLAKSLGEAGLDVWTPAQTSTRRRGPSRKREEFTGPIMPTFVFARASQLPDLVRITAAPFSPHPRFSIFRFAGRVPLIGEAEIAGARRVEEAGLRAAKMGQRHAFAIGEKVRVAEGPGAGLSGQVVRDGDGKYVLVAFGDISLKIGSWLLGTDEVQTGSIAA